MCAPPARAIRVADALAAPPIHDSDRLHWHTEYCSRQIGVSLSAFMTFEDLRVFLAVRSSGGLSSRFPFLDTDVHVVEDPHNSLRSARREERSALFPTSGIRRSRSREW